MPTLLLPTVDIFLIMPLRGSEHRSIWLAWVGRQGRAHCANERSLRIGLRTCSLEVLLPRCHFERCVDRMARVHRADWSSTPLDVL